MTATAPSQAPLSALGDPGQPCQGAREEDAGVGLGDLELFGDVGHGQPVDPREHDDLAVAPGQLGERCVQALELLVADRALARRTTYSSGMLARGQKLT